jgi:hypothetical protein
MLCSTPRGFQRDFQSCDPPFEGTSATHPTRRTQQMHGSMGFIKTDFEE